MESLVSVNKEKIIDIIQHNIDLTKILLNFKTSSEAKRFIEKNRKAKEKLTGKTNEECCSDNRIYLYEKLDTFEQVVKLSLSRNSISQNLKDILKYLSEKYYNIIDKSDSKKISDKDEKYLIGEIMKKGLVIYFSEIISKELKKEQKLYNDLQYLIADPKKKSHFWDNKISSIDFKNFMHQEYLKIDKLIDQQELNLILMNIDLLEKLNIFNLADINSLNVKYYDMITANSIENTDEIYELHKLCAKLADLPHFINSHAFQYLRVVWTVRIYLVKKYKVNYKYNNDVGEYGRVLFYIGNIGQENNKLLINYKQNSIYLTPNQAMLFKNSDDWTVEYLGDSGSSYAAIIEVIMYKKT